MNEFDFSKGGVIYGKFFPGIKHVSEAVKRTNVSESVAYDYQPGNGTRYDVVFTTDAAGETVMFLSNFRQGMIIPGPMYPDTSIGYMMEKMPKMQEGDCYALIPLINSFLEDQGS